MNQTGGREAQKLRTRALIVAAAGGLTQPTVEQAADAAGVSRATAYRYFPTQEALSVELESGDVWREIEALVIDPQTADVGTRLDRLIDALVSRGVRRRAARPHCAARLPRQLAARPRLARA